MRTARRCADPHPLGDAMQTTLFFDGRGDPGEPPPRRRSSLTCQRAATDADSLPIRIVSTAASWCASYRHPIGWRSTYGSHVLCATCHPPVDESIVAEWLQRDAAVDEQPPFPFGAGPDVPRPHALLSRFAAEARRDKAAKQLRQQRREAQR